jgi:hypothetical protein
MPLSANCHGTAMTPTAIRKVAMGVAVTPSGSNLVPTSVSFGIEDQRDEAPFIRMGKGQGLEVHRVNPSAVPVAAYRPPKAGPVVVASQMINFNFRDIAGTVTRKVAALATSYPGIQVVRSAAFSRRAGVVQSHSKAVEQVRGSR